MRAETLAKALGGRKAGFAWMARCPAHEDHAPSLAITDSKDGTVLVRCHAGCDQRNVIEALRALGLWEPARRYQWSRSKSHDCVQRSETEPGTIKRAQTALAIWQCLGSCESEMHPRRSCRRVRNARGFRVLNARGKRECKLRH